MSVSKSITDEDLRKLLVEVYEIEIEGIEELPRQDLEGIALSLNISFEEYNDDNLNDNNISSNAGIDDQILPRTGNSNNNMQVEDSFNFEDQLNILNNAIISSPDNITISSNTGDLTSDRPIDVAIMDVDESLNETIKAFCDVTGSDAESGRNFLEAMGWDLESAIAIFLGQSSPPKPKVKPFISRRTGRGNNTFRSYQQSQIIINGQTISSVSVNENNNNSDPNNVPNDTNGESNNENDNLIDAEDDEDAMPDINDVMSHIHGDIRSFLRAHSYHGDNSAYHSSGFDDMDINSFNGMDPYPMRKIDSYDADGIRKPDKVRKQNLLGGYNRQHEEELILGRAEDPSIEWLFDPPRHLSFPGSFDQAKITSTNEKRWLLINIQSHDEFQSHLLNRDTWIDETIQSLLRTNYIFWQRGHTSHDGKNYMRLYKIETDNLPYICIIDPRTGAMCKNLTGYFQPGDLCAQLVEFVETRSLEANAPVAKLEKGEKGKSSTNSLNSKDSSPDAIQMNDNNVENMTEEINEISQSNLKGPPSKDFGPIPEEPPEIGQDGQKNNKISIKLTNGKNFARRYNRNDTVQVLFAVAMTLESDASIRLFDLVTNYPIRSLSDLMDKTLQECNLFGSQVVFRWI
eukprot:gene8136-11014_t